MKEGGATPEERLAWGFRVVTARKPSEKEVGLLKDLFATERERYAKDVEAAKKVVANGDSKPDASLDPVDLAAYSLLGNLMLNLDETVMKN
jgi:hypothetical protein